MALPLELREKVYENLLCPRKQVAKYRRSEKIRDQGLKPAILRTCKQICEEASRVLYTKNQTFLIRADPAANFIMQDGDALEYLYDLPIASVGCGKIGGSPVLTIEISLLEQYVPEYTRKFQECEKITTLENGDEVPYVGPEKESWYIGFLPTLPKLCRFVTTFGSPGKLQLVVNMGRLIGRPSKSSVQMHSNILDCFREARGLGRTAILTEPEHIVKATEMADVMRKTLESYDEAFGLACGYEERILKELEKKRWSDARDIMRNAQGLFDLVTGFDNGEPNVNGMTVEKRREMERKEINLHWKYATCCLKLGKTGDVRHTIRQMFRETSWSSQDRIHHKILWHRIADGHCAIGKAYEIDGTLNCAAYSFLHALLEAPGHTEADRAVDRLEQRLKSSSKPDDVMARLNIDTVLKEFRHQPPSRSTHDAPYAVVEKFKAEYQAIERLLREPEAEWVSTFRLLTCIEVLV